MPIIQHDRCDWHPPAEIAVQVNRKLAPGCFKYPILMGTTQIEGHFVTPTAPAFAPASSFIRVPNSVLMVLDETSVDLFLQHDHEASPVLYRDAGYPLSRDRLSGLAQQCQVALFVRAEDYASFSNDLLDSLDLAMESDALPPTDRYELLQSAVSLEVEQSLHMVQCDTYVQQAKTIGRQIVSLVSDDMLLPADLFSIVRHDHQTFVHVTNVAAYITLLAKQLGMSDRKELETMAIGGLLHDIGKRKIPTSILNKTEPLNDREWEIIRRHPQSGYEELYLRDNLTRGQLMMVYQHHEHINGGGYPVGIVDDEIHPWARMLAVVDVFDALTGDRPYRNPMSATTQSSF